LLSGIRVRAMGILPRKKTGNRFDEASWGGVSIAPYNDTA